MEESKEEKKTKPHYYKKGEIFPIIASECPGWVCYAEKRVSDLVEPNISKAKSPQQLCGILSKLHMLTGKMVSDPSKLRVVTVMPCYDKKLEAVRPDFKLLGQGGEVNFGKEVDTVLATHEVLDLF